MPDLSTTFAFLCDIISVWHPSIFLSVLHQLQLCFKCMLDFMDTSQEQEHDFGVLLKQGAEGVSQDSIDTKLQFVLK